MISRTSIGSSCAVVFYCTRVLSRRAVLNGQDRQIIYLILVPDSLPVNRDMVNIVQIVENAEFVNID